MFSLILGGAASGKSEYAEALVQRLDGPRMYLATMEPFDEECRLRIARHRAMRADKGFTTVEQYLDIGGTALADDANLLLECLSNLVANEIFSPDGGGSASVLHGIAALQKRCRHLTIVTNEVFSDGIDYPGDTVFYLRQFAMVNRFLAARADFVVEMIAGCANILKGKEPKP